MRLCLLVLLTLLVGGCALPGADPARVAQADQAYALARRNDAQGLNRLASASLKAEDLAAAMPQVRANLYASTPRRSETTLWASQIVGGASTYHVQRLHHHPEGAVQADVVMVRENEGPWRLNGIHVVRVPAEVTRAYEKRVADARFVLAGKSVHQYLILLGACLSAVVCLGSAIFAGIRRRWGWMVGNLFAIGQLNLNWATGAVVFQPIYVTLLGAGFLKGLGPADAWHIMAAFPLPAVLFWSLGKWRKKPTREAARTDADV